MASLPSRHRVCALRNIAWSAAVALASTHGVPERRRSHVSPKARGPHGRGRTRHHPRSGTGHHKAGGYPVGPATTVSGALRLLNVERVDGAILDVDLRGEDVTPVVEALFDRDIPFIFHTGVGLPPELRQRCPGTPIHTKPVAAEALIGSLGALLAQGEERPAAA